uniref:FBD domain-containing protein n=1 Tax=Panagrellus redivivus TaxID=6233 RepID=A0A7E4WBL9_PANRE
MVNCMCLVQNTNTIHYIHILHLLGNALICDDKLNWFFGHLVSNNVKTAVNSADKVRCAPEIENFELSFGERLSNAVQAFMYRLLVNLGFAKGGEKGCLVAKGQLNWASDWWFNICK